MHSWAAKEILKKGLFEIYLVLVTKSSGYFFMTDFKFSRSAKMFNQSILGPKQEQSEKALFFFKISLAVQLCNFLTAMF